ncbi:penicillin-binding protein 2 [Sphingopyxis sp. YF1]|jgi:penicillin-binding protein 2|uniref:penicillin-binding protein 2 n=1 Tax=Sphingopyxis sp. YF1 TaxID=2482763 RepID=UPI001F61467F|nr:penicillin-binding protein 2 [Sphingopyxis sp. YF1]UNU42146.1 penicillin-binding protein 2 [Sphingopyxis sp. YF1]
MPRKKSPPITEAWRGLTFTRRALVVGGAQMAVGAALAARMAYISVIDNDRYVLESESNRVNLTLVPPRRGWIVDRHGKALANNRVSLRIDLIPDRLHKKEMVLGQLKTLLRLDGDAMERIERDLNAASGFQPVAVAEDLSEADYASILVRLPDLPGVAPQRGFARNYPTGAAVGHLIGYVGAPTAEEYQAANKDPLYITPGFRVGKDGLEKYFQPMLRGNPGAKRVEVTARGKVVRELDTTEDRQGKTVHLTIDADLQEYVARRMGRESGAAIVIDCQNGDILAFVSMPSFDPNSFSDGISNSEYSWLRADDHQPLINKATRGLYPPGSTLKPMAAIAAVEHGVDPSERHTCVGGYRLGSRFFRCLGTHGSLDMASAIMKSCNSYFYWLAHRLGYDAIAPTAKLLGLGEEFQLAGSNQRYGTIPDSAWKMRKYDQPWSASDSLNAVIGQGYVSVNPLQLAVMTARIASGRRLYPRLINRQFQNEALPFSPAALAVARKGMDLVVNGAGTAVRSRLPLDGITMAGKTGTAQVRGLASGSRGQGGAWKYRDHGLFVGFAPVDNPRYATAVVIEHGMGGSRAAAPVAKDFMTYLYDREKAMAALEGFEAGWGGTIKERMDRDYAAWKSGASSDPDPGVPQ